MSEKYAATEVFTPSTFPEHTYVRRDDERLEQRLRDALETPGDVISVSGPSKSGKTVLVERVVGSTNLITITGAGLQDGKDLWRRFATWLGLPSTSSVDIGAALGAGATAGVSAETGVPVLAKGKVEGSGSVSVSGSASRSQAFEHYGLQQVVAEIADSSFVLLIDDFHYMPRSAQSEVAQEIKEAARQGVKIVTASVPHRSDDVVRSNPELRGRVQAIDSKYWECQDLEKIAAIGFPLLNLEVDPGSISSFATESGGSPQLMQALCLQTCRFLDARETLENRKSVELTVLNRTRILEETSARSDYSSLVTKCHRGPRTRGTERKEFDFSDWTRGDIYRALLLAISTSPPRASFTYPELSSRISVVCVSEPPQPASIYQACSQIAKMALEMYPSQRVVEWDEDDSILDIVDPYFLFFIRNSDILQRLGTPPGSLDAGAQ